MIEGLVEGKHSLGRTERQREREEEEMVLTWADTSYANMIEGGAPDRSVWEVLWALKLNVSISP